MVMFSVMLVVMVVLGGVGGVFSGGGNSDAGVG